MSRDPRELDWRKHQRVSFTQPSADLRTWVSRYWRVDWTYETPYRQLVVPYPNVHLTFHSTGPELHGVSSGHVFQHLDGNDGVFGVAFRPGRFRPFLGRSVSTLTDTTGPVAEVFPDLPCTADVAGIEAYLRDHLPVDDPKSVLAAEIVEHIQGGPEVMRVDMLAKEFGTTVRRLQRLFAEHVGVGPKWVIRRYRLHEVTVRMTEGSRIDWAELAAELGYADQAHFTRDFTSMFGETPTRYAARY
ncbi:helix-turn-helix domain-containing protein [Actinocrispum sp. NPDC049592]|uniref:AraC family transcriptional regulator n=1 Tax=Actinocrispum sp. NPDC049592 TaxID=3154835 RepID=UPI00341BE025